jgi:phosphohistidine phosphatase
MVGHNPGFERLASQLVGVAVEMPTGSLLQIDLPIDDWREAGTKKGVLVRFLKPKELA